MNEFITTLYKGEFGLNATDIRLVLCIWYNNDYGKRKGVELSVSALANEINAHLQQVKKSIKKLINMDIIKVTENYSRKENLARWLMINPVSEWRQT